MYKNHTDKPTTLRAIIVSLANVESSLTSHFALGVLGYSNTEIPALLVALEVLSGAELYFWVIIPRSLSICGIDPNIETHSRGRISVRGWRFSGCTSWSCFL
jgi:hypothetical protein